MVRLTDDTLRELLELALKGKEITETEVLRFQQLSANMAGPLAEEVLRLRELLHNLLRPLTPEEQDLRDRGALDPRWIAAQEALRDAD